MTRFPVRRLLALVTVLTVPELILTLELYQFPPPPPMKPGWGSLPGMDLPQVVGLKAGDTDWQSAAVCVHAALIGLTCKIGLTGTPMLLGITHASMQQ